MEKDAVAHRIFNKAEPTLAVVEHDLPCPCSTWHRTAHGWLLHDRLGGKLFLNCLEALLRLRVRFIVVLLTESDRLSESLAGLAQMAFGLICEAEIIMAVVIARF